MGQGLCCNLNIKFPKLCCSQYLPCCAKSRPWDPDNPVGGDARQKTLQGAYDAALTARDYRAAERYKHQLWLTIEQVANKAIDDELAWMAYRQAALACVYEANDENKSSEDATELISKLQKDMLKASRKINKNLKQIESVRASRSRGYEDPDEGEIVEEDLQGKAWLVTGLITRTGIDPRDQHIAERRQVATDPIPVGHRGGQILMTLPVDQNSSVDENPATATFGQRQTASKKQPKEEAVVIVFRKGAYIKAFKKDDLEACLHGLNRGLSSRGFRGVDPGLMGRDKKDMLDKWKKFKEQKTGLTNLAPIWEIQFQTIIPTDDEEDNDDNDEEDKSTSSKHEVNGDTNMSLVVHIKEQCVQGDPLTFSVSNRLAAITDPHVIRCHSKKQMVELVRLVKQATQPFIRVSPLNKAPEPSTINQAIQMAPKESRTIIYIEPGLYSENVLIDRAVTLKPCREQSFKGPLSGHITKGSSEAKEFVVICPQSGAAVQVIHSQKPQAQLNQADEVMARTQSMRTIKLYDLVLRGNFDGGSSVDGNIYYSSNTSRSDHGRTSGAGESANSDNANAVVLYSKPMTEQSSGWSPLAPLQLIRCDIGFSPIGILASGAGAQDLEIRSGVLHSNQYAGIMVDQGARARVFGGSVTGNFCFGALVTGAKSVIEFDQWRPLKTSTAKPRPVPATGCMIDDHHLHPEPSCHGCTGHALPSPTKASVIHTNTKHGVLVSNCARAELRHCWVYNNNLSINGTGSSLQLWGNLFRLATNAVCVKAQRGTSIDCVQNISNRQMIAIDGQCMVNGHLCSIVKDHAGVMADKGNQQPGAPGYKYPLDAVLHIIDNRSHTQQKSARSQSFTAEVESNLLSRGVFGSSRDRKQFRDPESLMNTTRDRPAVESHFQKLSQAEEMVALREAFKVLPINHAQDSDQEDAGRGWCRPSQPGGDHQEIDDRGDLVVKKQCIIA